jgi:hypothetical protein
MLWRGLLWFKMWSSGRILWKPWWNFGFYKMPRDEELLAFQKKIMLYGVSRLVHWTGKQCSKTLEPNQDTRQIEEKRDKSVSFVPFQTVVFAVEKASANKEVSKFTVIICTEIRR